MGLLVVHPGALSTVQDQGRFGYRAWGVPIGGPFDATSATIANALVGNLPDCAVLELTLLGGTYEARAPLALALAGAPMDAAIVDGQESRRLSVPSCFTLQRGERLVLGGTSRGARTYLAVHGGWRTEPILGSRAQETKLRPGDFLPALAAITVHRRLSDPAFPEPLAEPLRIIDGPDSGRVPDHSFWEQSVFRVGSESDRMGVRLEGPPLPVLPDAERLSAPVAPGGIQVAGGQPIVLGMGCGTMGGYPLVAHVISADLARLGQLRMGDEVRFRTVSLAAARDLDREDRSRRRRLWGRIVALTGHSGIELA